MRTKFTLLSALVVAFFALNAQQVPNGGFETWSNAYTPTGWATVDGLFGSSLGFTTKDTADKVEGTTSIKVKSDSLAAVPQAGVVPGLVSLGTASYVAGQPSFKGIPFAFRPDTLRFAYKYSTPGTDTAGVQIVLFKSGSQPVLGGGIPLQATNGQWADVYVVLTPNYASGATPDTLLLQFYSSFSDVAPGVKGSTLNVDNVRFGYASACTAPTAPTAAIAGQSSINQGQSTTVSVSGGTLGDGTWNWYTGSCGGTAVGTGSTLAVTPASTTTYYVRGEGCGSSTACAQVTVTVVPVGVNEVATVTLSVFPNPATDVLTVNADQNLEGYSFEVMDVTGRVLSKTQLNGQTSTINVSDLAKGNYIYKIADKNNQLVTQNKFAIVK